MYKKNKTEQTLTMYHCLKFSDNWSIKWISHSLFSLEDPILSSGIKEVYINNAGSAYFGQGENPEKVRVTELNNNYWRHGWNIGIFKCWFTWYHLKIRAKILFIEYYFCTIIKDLELLRLYHILILQNHTNYIHINTQLKKYSLSVEIAEFIFPTNIAKITAASLISRCYTVIYSVILYFLSWYLY